MPTTPAGPLSLPLSHCRTLIAACPSFQTWAGAASAADAEAFIHLVGPPPPANRKAYTPAELAALRPLVIVDSPPSSAPAYESRRIALKTYRPGGRLFVTFEDDVLAEDAQDFEETKLRYLNHLGGVISDIEDLAGTANYLSVLSLHQSWIRRAAKSEVPTQGDYIVGALMIEWGL